MTTKIKAWAVVDPDGKIIMSRISESKEHLLFACLLSTGQSQWEDIEKDGYRCIPVTITPEGE